MLQNNDHLLMIVARCCWFVFFAAAATAFTIALRDREREIKVRGRNTKPETKIMMENIFRSRYRMEFHLF